MRRLPWEDHSRPFYHDWEYAVQNNLFEYLRRIFNCCYNIQRFTADRSSSLPAIIVWNKLETRLARLKTFVIPIFMKEIEETYADKHFTPMKMLSMISQWPGIQEIIVKSFSVRSVVRPWEGCITVRPYSKKKETRKVLPGRTILSEIPLHMEERSC